MNLENISSTHLENSQKILDEMSALTARVHGLKETMNFMLPTEIINSNDFYSLIKALNTYVTVNGMPVSLVLRGWSELIEQELQARGKIKRD